jgi:hypothetical protein
MDGKLESVCARVRLTIEMPAGSSWPEKVGADQVYKQAKEDVLGKLNNWALKNHLGLRIIGEPVVIAIMAELEKKP